MDWYREVISCLVVLLLAALLRWLDVALQPVQRGAYCAGAEICGGMQHEARVPATNQGRDSKYKAK